MGRQTLRQRRLLTDKYDRFTIGDKSNNGQDALLRIERGNVGLNGGIDNKRMDGYSEPTTLILRGLVWNYHQKRRGESMRKRRRGLRHEKR